MDGDKIIRTKEIDQYPCVLISPNGGVRIYTDISDPSKDVLNLAGVKKVHMSAPGLGSIIYPREIAPGSTVLYSVMSRYLWVREDLNREGLEYEYYIRADDALPGSAKIKIEVE
jgi:hypothetical protein